MENVVRYDFHFRFVQSIQFIHNLESAVLIVQVFTSLVCISRFRFEKKLKKKNAQNRLLKSRFLNLLIS